jgi:heparan-sulfate lyase
VDKTFLVLLDEAIGQAKGKLDLHYQLAVGDIRIDARAPCVTTGFDDVNVLIWSDPSLPISVTKEEGWFGWTYGKRMPRPAVSVRHGQPAPAAFLTVLVPYRGSDVPKVSAAVAEGFTVGADEAAIRVEALGKTWQLGRDLKNNRAWCRPK